MVGEKIGFGKEIEKELGVYLHILLILIIYQYFQPIPYITKTYKLNTPTQNSSFIGFPIHITFTTTIVINNINVIQYFIYIIILLLISISYTSQIL